jgi:hypothetical protein
MHFDLTITPGQIVIFCTLLGAVWKFDRILTFFTIEHEMLIEDYCERKGIDLSSMPTRMLRSRWGRKKD